jgi:hypothetical protein
MILRAAALLSWNVYTNPFLQVLFCLLCTTLLLVSEILVGLCDDFVLDFGLQSPKPALTSI